MANTRINHTAAFFGRKAQERISWITAADFASSLNSELFPYWQASAVAYAVAAAKAARQGEGFDVVRAQCGARVESAIVRRPANALNLEIGKPSDRCLNQRPAHWPEGSSSLRWIHSGGSPLVFGECSARSCPEVRHG